MLTYYVRAKRAEELSRVGVRLDCDNDVSPGAKLVLDDGTRPLPERRSLLGCASGLPPANEALSGRRWGLRPIDEHCVPEHPQRYDRDTLCQLQRETPSS